MALLPDQDAPIEITSADFVSVAQLAANGPPTAEVWPVGVSVAGDGYTFVEHRSNVVNLLTAGEVADRSSAGTDWFERFHVIPREVDLGNVLTDQSITIEVFSAYRRTDEEWTSLTNNAGTGATITGAPALPTDVEELNSVTFTLDVDDVGQAFVDGSLDFVFASGSVSIPVTIQRIVLWSLEPELPLRLRLSSLTDILESRDGSERRQGLRGAPRATWLYDYAIDEGPTLQLFENILFDTQARNLGIPLFVWEAELTADANASDTTISVDSTALKDFRVGGLVVILTSQAISDVLTIDSFTATTITFTAGLVNSYTAGTKVYPNAASRAPSVVQGQRYPVNLATMRIAFEVVDNVVDLADVSSFPTFNGELLLDSCNSLLSGTLQHDFRQELDIIDNGTGIVDQTSLWDRHKRGYPFTLRAEGKQAIWDLLGLAYYLDGRRVSFYVPRASDDLAVVTDLVASDNRLDVTNVGYTQFVRQRQPKNAIRLTLANGTTLERFILSSSVTSSTVEQLTVDVVWPSAVSTADIVRVEYIEKVRLDTDDVEIIFTADANRAYLEAPVRAVFE